MQKRVWERDLYRCCECGTHLDLSVDHIIPESRGGNLDLDNLRTLCRSCNSRKGARA
ncbi:MAG: HNH endonuclease [Thermomicrobia bacterium]|nr:HNH endonuclease [Thermomicrobia bacterium]